MDFSSKQLDLVQALLDTVPRTVGVEDGADEATTGDVALDKIGWAGVLHNMAQEFDELVGGGKGDLSKALRAIGNTMNKLSTVVAHPYSAFVGGIGILATTEAGRFNAGFMSDLEWNSFFKYATDMAYRFETEEDRTEKLTLGEFYACLANALFENLNEDAFKYPSPYYKATGVRRTKTFGSLLSELRGDLNRMAQYLGARPAPKLVFDKTDIPEDYEPPFSMG